ncbi:MAG TPA: hypothetical protein VKE74_26005, partial [Gemmataceae bacterium]|nr:hypothetical protein [Gemmataceae bacterium]
MSRAVPLVVLSVVLCAAGCALTAKKTPTPADDIRSADLLQTPVPPNERYYVLFFGSNDRTRRPAYTHTWATVVRAVETPGCTEPTLEVHTISWLPATLEIHPLRFAVEPGTNVELHATIAHSLATNQEIAMWG